MYVVKTVIYSIRLSELTTLIIKAMRDNNPVMYAGALPAYITMNDFSPLNVN